MKRITLFAFIFVAATSIAFAAGAEIDPNGLTQQHSARTGHKTIGSESLIATLTPGSQCIDYGSGYGTCSGPIDHININQSMITFTMDLPSSEISKLSCNGGASYANFYLADTPNYDELYDGLRYALAHNKVIRIGVTNSPYSCTVSYLHIFPAN